MAGRNLPEPGRAPSGSSSATTQAKSLETVRLEIEENTREMNAETQRWEVTRAAKLEESKLWCGRVRGAGDSRFNGAYKHDTARDLIEGEPAFSFTSNHDKSSTGWYLGKDYGNARYVVMAPAGGVPPSGGWECHDMGKHPPPTIVDQAAMAEQEEAKTCTWDQGARVEKRRCQEVPGEERKVVKTESATKK